VANEKRQNAGVVQPLRRYGAGSAQVSSKQHNPKGWVALGTVLALLVGCIFSEFLRPIFAGCLLGLFLAREVYQ
jgi:hypothetical protein